MSYARATTKWPLDESRAGFGGCSRRTQNQTFSSVWDAIEDTPEQAQNMKLRSVLMMAIKDQITRSGMSQAEAAKFFCVTQPRISDLMRGKINLFALDALVNMAVASGMRVEMQVSAAPAKRGVSTTSAKTAAGKKPATAAPKKTSTSKPATKASTRPSKERSIAASHSR